MPVVKMPDGQLVELPDNPSPEQLAGLAALQDSPLKAAAKETGRVVHKGVQGGLTGMPGMMGEVAAGYTRDPGAAMRAGPGGLAMALPGFLLEKLTGEKTPGFGETLKGVQDLGGAVPLSKPQTETGKALGNILEAGVGAVAGGGPASAGSKLFTGLAAGTGSEGAARLFGDNMLTRLLGGLAGGSGAAAIQAAKPNATSMIKQATEQVTDADWKRAKVLESTLDKEGISHLKSQVLGPRSTLDDVVSTASTHPRARPKLITKVENSAEEARKAVERNSMANLPINIGERPKVLDDVQGLAEAHIQGLKGKSNEVFVKKMPALDLEYPEAKVADLYRKLTGVADSPKYGPTSPQGTAIKTFAEKLKNPDWSPELDGVASKYLTNAHQINNLIKGDNLRALKKEGLAGLPDKEIKALVQAATPEFDAARTAKQTFMENNVNPAQKSLLGQIANLGGGQRPDKVTASDRAVDLVFSKTVDQPQAIKELAGQIGGDGVGQLLREHISKNLNATIKASKDQGHQVQTPVDFVHAIAGTPAQRKNLEAAIIENATAQGANPWAVRNGFYKLLKALETTKDLKIAGGVDRASMGFEAGKNLAGAAVAPASRAGRWLWERATAKTYSQIADMVTAKGGLAQLEAIAKAPGQDLARQILFSTVSATAAGEEK
jgi:hypothetical protein